MLSIYNNKSERSEQEIFFCRPKISPCRLLFFTDICRVDLKYFLSEGACRPICRVGKKGICRTSLIISFLRNMLTFLHYSYFFS